MTDDIVYTLHNNITPHALQSEAVVVITHYHDNGDAKHGMRAGVFATQEIKLCGHTSEAVFRLGDMLSPQALRKLADDLEAGYDVALTKVPVK